VRREGDVQRLRGPEDPAAPAVELPSRGRFARLETLLSQRGEAFEEKTVVIGAIPPTSVISYLHNQQPEPIIVRDLKPSNVTIRAEDEALVLVDLGIARSFAPQQRGTMIAAEDYAPPEQYKGIADARG